MCEKVSAKSCYNIIACLLEILSAGFQSQYVILCVKFKFDGWNFSLDCLCAQLHIRGVSLRRGWDVCNSITFITSGEEYFRCPRYLSFT